MANPTVDKLKTLGLKYGDKVAVALTGALCLVCIFLALNKDTIDTSPTDLTELANRASSNLSKNQDEATILEKLQQDGLVLENFEEIVASRETEKLDPSDFELARSFVKAEPGAGLIREGVQDVLLAPYEAIATAGRGGIPYYQRDASGNFIPLEPGEEQEGFSGYPGMMAMGSEMAYGSGSGSAQPKESAREKQLAEQKAELARQKALSGIAGGNVQLPPGAAEEEPTSTAATGDDVKTEVEGRRWVAVVALLNHKQLREKFATALKLDPKDPASHPDYKRAELQRQLFDPIQGAWSDWEMVDPETLEDITRDIAFEEEQSEQDKYIAPEARLDPLVGFLPFLSAGYWSGVYHPALVSQERLQQIVEETKPKLPPGGMAGMGYGMDAGMGSDYMAMMEGMEGMPEMTYDGSSSDMMGMGMGMGMGYGMGMGMGMTGQGPAHMTEEDIILVRALDFTVQPDTIYRYRVRYVVANPNYNREDVAPGVDSTAREFASPWSEPTDLVKVPADVSIYAMSPGRGSTAREGAVSFDVLAWDPESGHIAFRNFGAAAPGEFVGSPMQTLVAVEGEEEPENKVIDFQSRQLVIDTAGGPTPVQQLALPGTFEVPALAVTLRPDGTISLHSQAEDVPDEQRSFMKQTYDLSISNEENKKSMGSDMGMMGMMGYGY